MIAKLKGKKPFLFEFERDEPLSAEKLDALEREFHIKFPLAYRHHLATEGAGDFGYSKVFSPDPSSGWSLWTEYDYMPQRRHTALPFSDNGGGDYYCFPIERGVCADRVIWADHEDDYSLSETECPTFIDFVFSVCLNEE